MILEKRKIMKKTILKIVAMICLAAIGSIAIYSTSIKDSDAFKFKKEYEALNGTIRESDDALYNDVKIPTMNPIKYISALEAVEVLENEKGLIYFGAPWCPWCRNAVEVLFDVAHDNEIKTIYYVDMDTVRNIWEAKNGKLVKTQEEATGYYDLLKALDPILGDNTYVVEDENGVKFDTKEKRIYMPLVVAFKDAKIVDYHVGTVDIRQDQTKYSKLTSEQKKELTSIYQRLVDKIK